ncbi:DUF1572 family protein [Singulisphaera rosea]
MAIESTTGESADVASAFIAEARRRLCENVERIEHGVNQLDDAQVWWRPHESLNSIANLLLHLNGNLRQWIVSGVGGVPDVRDRPREFSERDDVPKAELLRGLEAVVAEADRVLAGLDASTLLEPRRIQGFDETALAALWQTLGHLSGHTQEIILMTRLQLADRYTFAWTPKTPEQGAPV